MIYHRPMMLLSVTKAKNTNIDKKINARERELGKSSMGDDLYGHITPCNGKNTMQAYQHELDVNKKPLLQESGFIPEIIINIIKIQLKVKTWNFVIFVAPG